MEVSLASHPLSSGPWTLALTLDSWALFLVTCALAFLWKSIHASIRIFAHSIRPLGWDWNAPPGLTGLQAVITRQGALALSRPPRSMLYTLPTPCLCSGTRAGLTSSPTPIPPPSGSQGVD